MTDEEKRADSIQGLKDLVEFLEQNPSIPAPRWNTLNVPLDSKEDLARIARTGSWTKSYTDYYLTLKKEFKGNLTLDVYIDRQQVCRKVITGTRIIPAAPATEEREEVVEEWVCEDLSILAPAEA